MSAMRTAPTFGRAIAPARRELPPIFALVETHSGLWFVRPAGLLSTLLIVGAFVLALMS
jgi:hypothetical protein